MTETLIRAGQIACAAASFTMLACLAGLLPWGWAWATVAESALTAICFSAAMIVGGSRR